MKEVESTPGQCEGPKTEQVRMQAARILSGIDPAEEDSAAVTSQRELD